MRLFVAIDLPDSIKQQISTLKVSIPTARWSRLHQMHITLFFLGDTDRVQAIKAVLETVQAARFDLTLSGVGRFPKGGKKPARVLWVGIDPQPALSRLHEQVTAGLVDRGFPHDDRPFSPHITLARLKLSKPAPEVKTFLDANRSFQISAIPITHFTLYSSALTSQGPRYTHEAVYPLGVL